MPETITYPTRAIAERAYAFYLGELDLYAAVTIDGATVTLYR